MHRVTLLLALCALFVLVGCEKSAPKSDSTPPKLHLSHWERNQSGGQGAQKTINPGEQTEVPSDWIGGQNKADIRVVGDDAEGVTKLEVTGSATAKCSTGGSQPIDFNTNLILPKQTKTVDQGTVKDLLAVHLDEFLSKPSCGTKKIEGVDKEFFMTSGTWTISAHVENCCGGKTDGTFTIVVK